MNASTSSSLRPARLAGALGLAVLTALTAAPARAQIRVDGANLGTNYFINGGSLTSNTYTSVGDIGDNFSSNLIVNSGGHFTTNGSLDLQKGFIFLDGGNLTTHGYVGLGKNWAGATGAIYLENGSSYLATDYVGIGVDGDYGQHWSGLSVNSGSNFTNTHGVTLGENASGAGLLSVSDTGSTAQVQGFLNVGYHGKGDLSVSGGGIVSLQGAASSFNAGQLAGSDGVIGVSHAGSKLIAENNAMIGGAGQGYLHVNDGGEFHVEKYLGVGQEAGGTGNIDVTNGGKLTVGDELHLGEGHSGPSAGYLLASDSGSSVQVGHGLIVGQWGNGALTVQNGATVTTGDHFDIAAQTGSSGVVTVSGTGSSLSTTGNAYLGAAGAGAMSVESGGGFHATGWSALGIDGVGTLDVRTGGTATFDQDLVLGHNATGQGTLNLYGAGGNSVTVGGALAVGRQGAGTLNLFDGSSLQVNGWALLVGGSAGGSGTVTVNGAGTSLGTTGDFHLGEAGTGSLEVMNGGSFHATGWSVLGIDTTGTLAIRTGGTATFGGDLVLGQNAGGQGTLNLDGAGSTATVGGAIEVGQLGTGTISLSNGAALNVTGWGTIVGNSSGGSGTLTVDGAGSTWTNSGDLLLGWAGTGSLAVSNGGAVSTHVLTVGGDFSTGTGHGALAISSGGTVSSFDGLIGNSSGSTGAVTVDGAGSAWHISSDLEVGLSGTGATGALAITNGGAVTAGWYMGIGDNGNAGAVTVDGPGSSLSVVGGLDLGDSGPGMGTLAITHGGSVSNNYSNIGGMAGSVGAVTVDGTGSTWTASGDLQVGFSGTGSLAIINGGVVSSASSSGFTTSIGRIAGGLGTVSVDGSGSSWTIADQLIVGNAGTGSLAITHGGAVATTSMTVAANTGSTGAVTVDGAGSSLSVLGGLDLGLSGPGTGTLAITHGGSVSTHYANLGGLAGGVGAVTVDGAGSAWTASGDLQVGFSGTGSLAITNGGAVSSASSSGFTTSIGRTSGSVGTVSVDGAGSTWTIADQLLVGNAGTGSLAITHGGAVAATALTIAANAGSSGTVTVDGGTLNTSAITINTGGMLNYNSSSLIAGAINSSTITNAGQFALNTRDPIAGSADTRTLGATVANQAGGRIDVNLANAASVTFTGPVTNDGMFQITQLAGTSGGVTTFTNTFTNNGTFSQDPTTTHFAELFNAGYFSAGEGDQILVDAGFHNDGHLSLTGSTLSAGAGLINHGLVDIFGGAEVSGDYSGPGALLFHIGSATDQLFFTSGFSGSLELVFDPGYLLLGTENFLHFNQGAYLSSLLIGGVDFGSRDFSGPGFLAGNGSFLAGSVPDSASTLGLFGLALGLLFPLRRRLATS